MSLEQLYRHVTGQHAGVHYQVIERREGLTTLLTQHTVKFIVQSIILNITIICS